MYKAIIKTKKGIVTYNIQNTNELNKICEQPYDEIRIEHEITKEDLIKERDELLHHVVGMTYRTPKALELTKKIREMGL